MYSFWKTNDSGPSCFTHKRKHIPVRPCLLVTRIVSYSWHSSALLRYLVCMYITIYDVAKAPRHYVYSLSPPLLPAPPCVTSVLVLRSTITLLFPHLLCGSANKHRLMVYHVLSYIYTYCVSKHTYNTK